MRRLVIRTPPAEFYDFYGPDFTPTVETSTPQNFQRPNSDQLGFAVPSDTIVLIAQRIIAGESLDLGFIGLEGDTPVDGTVGALVTRVVAGQPGEAAGLQVGDLIIGLEGDVVSSMEELSADVKLYRPGETIELEIVRDGERLIADVTLASQTG